MSSFWSAYINRELPLRRALRKAIYRDAWRLWFRDKTNVVIYLTLPASYLLGVFYAGDVAGRLAWWCGASGAIVTCFRAAAPLVLALVCFVIGGMILQRLRFAPCVHQVTRDFGFEVCVKCGYWLKGLTPDIRRCPECGVRRQPMVAGR